MIRDREDGRGEFQCLLTTSSAIGSTRCSNQHKALFPRAFRANGGAVGMQNGRQTQATLQRVPSLSVPCRPSPSPKIQSISHVYPHAAS
jgi:hypothetical protein